MCYKLLCVCQIDNINLCFFFLLFGQRSKQMVTRRSSLEKYNSIIANSDFSGVEKLLRGKWEFSFKIVVSMCKWVWILQRRKVSNRKNLAKKKRFRISLFLRKLSKRVTCNNLHSFLLLKIINILSNLKISHQFKWN